MKLQLLSFAAAALAVSSLPAQVAITEFLNDPDGTDTGREYVELFNYSASDVDLTGWTLSDEDFDSVALPSITLPSGGYLVVVAGNPGDTAAAKAGFEAEWFSGAEQSNVFGISGLAIANSGDELILANSSSDLVWSLAYLNGETPGLATFMTEIQLWTIPNMFGDKEGPAIDRNGFDFVAGNPLGYEDAAEDYDAPSMLVTNPRDPFAYLSTDTDGIGSMDPGFGSPGKGGYEVVPEPSFYAAIAGLSVLALVLYRRCTR